MKKLRWVTGLGLLVSAPAWAWVFFENPAHAIISINRPSGDVISAVGYVESVRMHACGGGYTDFPVNATKDLKSPFTKQITGGNWCGVSVRWGSNVEITNGTWTVEYSELATPLAIETNPSSESTALTPFDVVGGTYSGLAPRLYVTIAD